MRQIKQARPVEQSRVHCRPAFKGYAGGQNSRAGSGSLAGGMAVAGEAGVVSVAGLDVECNPVGQRKYAGKPPGINARSVQPDPESEPTHRGHGLGEVRICGRFAAGEDHAIEQITAHLQQFENLRPAIGGFGGAPLQVRIVAIAAAPWTTLDKHHRNKPFGPIDSRKRHETADGELLARSGWPAAGLCCLHIHNQAPGERQRAGSNAPGSNGSSASSVFLTSSPSSVSPSNFSRRVKNRVSGSSCRVASFQ